MSYHRILTATAEEIQFELPAGTDFIWVDALDRIRALRRPTFNGADWLLTSYSQQGTVLHVQNVPPTVFQYGSTGTFDPFGGMESTVHDPVRHRVVVNYFTGPMTGRMCEYDDVTLALVKTHASGIQGVASGSKIVNHGDNILGGGRVWDRDTDVLLHTFTRAGDFNDTGYVMGRAFAVPALGDGWTATHTGQVYDALGVQRATWAIPGVPRWATYELVPVPGTTKIVGRSIFPETQYIYIFDPANPADRVQRVPTFLGGNAGAQFLRPNNSGSNTFPRFSGVLAVSQGKWLWYLIGQGRGQRMKI